MAKEILAIPEERLIEVIAVIRAGLEITETSDETREQLMKWCNEEEEEAYITNTD